MRLIIPSEDIDARSHAERKVAGLLAEIRSDDGVAYHSVRLPRHRKKVLGEVDFVVLWKGTILVLEVKGGRIGRTGKGLWYSMDRGGHRHPLRRSPWVQAEDAALTLLHVLSRPSDDGGWPFAYAVVTPDQALAADTEADTEGVLQQHLGSEQMTPAGMERGLDALARLARPLPADQDHPRRLDLGPMGNLPEVLTHLRGEVDAMRTMPTPEWAAEGSVHP